MHLSKKPKEISQFFTAFSESTLNFKHLKKKIKKKKKWAS